MANDPLPSKLFVELMKQQDLRYGENPHQKAALYVGETRKAASVAFASQLQGKELPYNLLVDADAALNCEKEFVQAAGCIVKHTRRWGCAAGGAPPAVFNRKSTPPNSI